MALLHVAKMGKYDTFVDIDDEQYANSSGTSLFVFSTDGQFGDRALTLQSSGQTVNFEFDWEQNSRTSDTTLIVAFNMYFDNSAQFGGAVSQHDVFLTMRNSSVFARHWGLGVNNMGDLQLFPQGFGNNVYAYRALVPSAWNYIEIKATKSDTGTFEVRVNGVTVMNVGSVDLLSGTAPWNALVFNGLDENVIYDDIIIMDGSGASFNDFQGEMRLECALPNADGATVDWTRNTGASDFAAIDDALGAYDDDTTYIESSTAGEDALAAYPAISGTPVDIHFVAVAHLIKNAAGAPEKFATICDSGATVGVAATITPSTSYGFYTQWFENDPDTAAAWNTAGVNAAEFGVRSVT